MRILQVDKLPGFDIFFKPNKFLGIKVKETRFTIPSDLRNLIYLILEFHVFFMINS